MSQTVLLRSISRILWVVVWFAVAAVRASAAGVVSHQPITQHTAEAPVVINAVVSSPVDVAGVNLFYRLAGEDGYIDVEMDRTVEGWRAEIPLDYLTPAGVEYFISATLADGTTVTFPEDDPENAPVRVDVLLPSGSQPPGQPEETVEVPVQPAIGEKAILIFSPVPESKVPFDAVLISASLFHIDSVDVSSVRLLVDGQDVTPRSSVGADLVIYEPASMTPGIHRVRIDVKTVDGRVVEPKVWSFVVTKKLEAEVEREFTYRGRVNGGYSLDAIEGKQLSIGMTAASLSGQWRGMRFKSDLKLTSEEDPFKQPRNRYRFSLDAGKYLSLSLGDFNSRISRFTLDGKRVRGVDFDLKLGWVNLHVVKGELDRTVQGRLDPDESLFLDQIEVERGELDTTRNNIIYRLNRKGFTFQKDITAARLSFGGGKKFQLGFNWLKAKDDITSVDRFLTDALITVTQDSSGPIPLDITPGEYSYGDLRGLIDSRENYSLLMPEKDWEGDTPQDNIVIGSDIQLFLDNKRLGVEAGWAFSMLNKNIWDGPFSLVALDTLIDDTLDYRAGDVDISSFPDPADYEDIFVINENMVPLVPIDPDSARLADDPMGVILDMPSLAYNVKATARYFHNHLNFQYIKVGPEFNSLGNPYILKNNQEYTVSDRIGLFRNRLLVNLSYRHQDDDILRTVPNVTATNTLRANLGIYPGSGLPSVTLSFRKQDRDNGKSVLDTVRVDTAGHRIELEDLRDFTRTRNTTLGINHQLSFFGFDHSVSVNYISLAREDQFGGDRPSPPFYTVNTLGDTVARDSSFVSPNLTSKVTNISVVTEYPFPLKTTLILSVNNSTFGKEGDELYDYGDQNITSLAFSGTYDMVGGRLQLLGDFEYTSGVGVEEFGRTGIGAGFKYRITDVLRFRFDGKFRSKSTNGETKTSTLVRASLNYSF